MEKNHLLKAMKISISEVLETMFFLPIDRTEIAEENTFHSALNENLELVEVEFSGIFSGSILPLVGFTSTNLTRRLFNNGPSAVDV